MKKIILHNISAHLGVGVDSIKSEDNKKWLYLLPSMSLISEVKEKIIKMDESKLEFVEFITFDQLMRKTMYSSRIKMLSPSEQEIIVKRVIEKVNKENGLKYFKNSIEKSGWISKVEMWIGEIKRAGITTNQLFNIWENHSNKYQELANIYHTYQEIIKQYSLIDHEEPYFMFLDNKENNSKFFNNYSGIITEQFYDFSPIQMNVLNAIGDINVNVDIHFSVDENRKDLFQLVYNCLEYLSNLDFIQVNSQVYENKSIALEDTTSQLKKYLFTPFPQKVDAKKNITIVSTSGREQEIEEICAEIKYLIINSGVSTEEIAIVVSQMKKYQYFIEKQMDRAGIPIKSVRKEPLISNPLSQSLLSFIKASKTQKEEWINILTSPYFKWCEDIDSTVLVKIFRELSYPMVKKEWDDRFKGLKRSQDDRNLTRYDKVMQQIYSLVSLIPEVSSSQKYIDFLNKVEEDLQVKNKLLDYISAKPDDELAYRDIKAYTKWQDVKNEIISLDNFLDNKEKTNFWNWYSQLILAVEKTEYDFTQGKKEGINLLQPNQIRGREYEIVFILGLVEGEFPRPIKNDWLLPDLERFILKNNGYSLNFSGDYINSQKYQFFQSVIAARSKFYLIYSSKSEAGGENLRSFYIDECLDLFDKDSVLFRNRELSDKVAQKWERCINEQQFINKIYFDLYKYQINDKETKLALTNYKYLKNKYPNKLELINQGILSEYDRKNMINSQFDGYISDDSNKAELYKKINTNVWSTTQLNLAKRCRFAYFAQYVLKLSEWKEQEESLTPIEKGDLLHRVLERFFEQFYDEKNNRFNVDLESEYLKQVQMFVSEEWNLFELNKERIIDTILGDIDLEKIRKILHQIISHEIWWRKQSSDYFYPKHLEYPFNINTELLNKSILLKGRIDRVDINSEGKFIIYDYKSGNLPTNKEIQNGVNLQLPLYLMVLQSVFNNNLESSVGAAFYGKGDLKDGKFKDNRNIGIWKKSLANKVGISDRVASSLEDAEWYDWINNTKGLIENLVNELEDGDFAVLPTMDCPSYCPYKQICRKDDQVIKVKRRIREDK